MKINLHCLTNCGIINVMMPDFHEMRDPIHGFVKLFDKEMALINTRVFQRLRRIRQLAMTFLVYPGAVHTRFDHSIGVMHIAGRICAKLRELNPEIVREEDIARIRFSALLHDIGHGPFSHVSEALLEKYAPNQTQIGATREKIHEKITVDILETDTEINAILSAEERDFVVEMIRGQETQNWQRDIVSSELDADKMDYLLRDAYFAGVKYGVYDLEKLIESCLIDSDKTETSLAINSKGIYALEQLLLARYHMTQQVYWHRVSLISNEMIIRGITLAIEGGNREMGALYRYNENNKAAFVQKYLDYHDEKVVDLLKSCAQEKACDIFNRLYSRNLFKMVAELRLKGENRRTQRRLIGMADEHSRERQSEKEKEIAAHLNIDADYVIIKPLQIRNPNYGSRSYILDPEAITIFDEKQSESRSMSDYTSELFFARPATNDEASFQTVQVYAPLDLAEKQNLLELDADIQDILRSD